MLVAPHTRATGKDERGADVSTTAWRRDDAEGRESGFGLVEVIVSMVLLSVIALAFLPLAAQSATSARKAATLSTATRLVSGQMEVLRATTVPGCLPDPGGAGYPALVDDQGVTWRLHADSTGTCPLEPVTYTVWVTRSTEPTVRLATASTTLWADVQ
jgi:prepilin-type N-terminal cleavage/methylation domain-containing protein